MFGRVSSYSVQTGEGVIFGDDGSRYSFASRDWMGTEVPRPGVRVEFVSTDNQAASVNPIRAASEQRNHGTSPFPAIAVGCGAGCATYFVLGFILSFVVGMGLRVILSPGSGNEGLGIVAPAVALVSAVVVGVVVYRAMRNRRR